MLYNINIQYTLRLGAKAMYLVQSYASVLSSHT